MQHFKQPVLIIFSIFLLTLMGCASKPPHYTPLAPTASTYQEIDRTKNWIEKARLRQMDVLSPSNFAKAENRIEKARDKQVSGKSDIDVLEQVAYSRGWLSEAMRVSKVAETQMPGITDARKGALRARANDYFPKEWASNDKDLEKLTRSIERGNIKPSGKSGPSIVADFRSMESQGLIVGLLDRANSLIKSAEVENAPKVAPVTYNTTMAIYLSTQKLIQNNPRDTALIRKASNEATDHAEKLLAITRKVNAGATEEFAIRSLQGPSRSKQVAVARERRDRAKLACLERLLGQAKKVRSQFEPTEAEVFTENGKVMVRLKALNFPTNQATLKGSRNQALLQKVNRALDSMGPARVLVEGHTDSTGSNSRNLTLSEQRAQSVKDYLVVNGVVPRSQVNSVGLGSEKPIGSNNNANGRSLNRRVDLVIEPLTPTLRR